MYSPAHFSTDDAAAIFRLLQGNPLANVISLQDGQPQADTLPICISGSPEALRIRAHVARANPLWSCIEAGAPLLLLFNGPHAYISPGWYEAPGVPTWNYATVQLRGRPRVLASAELQQLLLEHVQQQELTVNGNWQADLNGEHQQRLLALIGGFELEDIQCTAKFKLSQNRAESDRQRVRDQLLALGQPQADAIAFLMAEQASR